MFRGQELAARGPAVSWEALIAPIVSLRLHRRCQLAEDKAQINFLAFLTFPHRTRRSTCFRAVAHGAFKCVYSLPLRIAAMTRGLRCPCMTATTHNGFFSGA
jgi:hypothetical protein